MATRYNKYPKMWHWKGHSYNWFFFMLAIGIAVFTELFYHQKSANISTITREEQLPHFRPEEIEAVILQNKLHMLRLHKDATGHWISQNNEKNTQIPVREDFMNGLLSTISTLNLQKYYPNDSLNRANFSLNEPLATMTLSLSQNRNYRFKIGISNPISKSSYITINDSPKIFQIDMINKRIMNFQDEQIFDDRIFSFNLNKIESISVTWPQIQPEKVIKLDKDEQRWVNQQNQDLNIENVNLFLKTMRNIKSLKIVQLQGDDQQFNNLTELLKKPLFKIEVKFLDETYTFEGIRGNNRELASAFKNSEFYFVKESKRNEFSVMSRDDFYNLSIAIRNIK